MKILFFVVSIVIAACSYGQDSKQKMAASTTAGLNTVPAEVITDDSTFWTISTVSTIGYVNTTPGADYNTYRSGGGMLVKFKFKKNNRFEFRLYVQANAYGTASEAWTHVEGTVEFTKDEKGQNIFITKAERGTYRTSKNGSVNSRAIPADELKAQHSNTYLWEKTTFPDDPQNIYLLTVDLDAHPEADINNPKTIDPSWVSKFHIPVKK
jgi:sarcosine oxidase delta subunit